MKKVLVLSLSALLLVCGAEEEGREINIYVTNKETR